ncbi:MAG TPA: signal peptidase II [Actinocrinis sp.]|nr:signal peptidase II [Actinocrinis sp.]
MDNAAAAPSPDQTPDRTSTPAPDAQPARPARPAGRRRRIGVLLAVAAAAYVLDLASKLLVVARLAGHAPIHLIGSAVQLTYTRNSGAAFSLGLGYTVAFSLIAIVVVVAILRVSRRLYSMPWAIALGLLLGGALGNLTDRIARSPGFFRGWVVDFVDVPHFAVFNLADSAISVGGVLMVLLAFLGLHPDGTDERAAKAAAASAGGPDPAGPDDPARPAAGADGPHAPEPEPAPDKVEQ